MLNKKISLPFFVATAFLISNVVAAQSSFTSGGPRASEVLFNLSPLEGPFLFEFDFDIGSSTNTGDGEFQIDTVSFGAPASLTAGDLVFEVGTTFGLTLFDEQDPNGVDTVTLTTNDILLPSGFSADSSSFRLTTTNVDLQSSDLLESFALDDFDDDETIITDFSFEFQNLTTPSGEFFETASGALLIAQAVPEPSSTSLILFCVVICSARRSRIA